MARMEHEMSLVQNRFKAIEQSYGTDVLNLVLARGYANPTEPVAIPEERHARHFTDLTPREHCPQSGASGSRYHDQVHDDASRA